MGKQDEHGISWTHYTFNPWWGCLKVSPGCANCYAETFAKRTGWDIWGPPATTRRRTFGDAHWAEPLKWNAEAAKAGERRRVFCASMADVFEDHPSLPPIRERLWALIEQTPALDWLLLTKRPQNIGQMLPRRWAAWEVPYGRVPRNVWLGTSAEDQEQFDSRWPVLAFEGREWGVSVLFLSAEPLLGPLDMSVWIDESDEDENHVYVRGIDWVIVGGESGPKARPMHPEWVRRIRDLCAEHGVPFHFKQWGEWIAKPLFRGQRAQTAFWGCMDVDGIFNPQTTTWNGRQGHPPDGYEYTMLRVGKRLAGRELDGRVWDEFPGDHSAALAGLEGVMRTAPASASDDLYPSAERTDRDAKGGV